MNHVLPFQRSPMRSPSGGRAAANTRPGPTAFAARGPVAPAGANYLLDPHGAGGGPPPSPPPRHPHRRRDLGMTPPPGMEGEPSGYLFAPEPLSPADGGRASMGDVTLAWREVPDAQQYYLSVCATPDFAGACMIFDEPVQASQQGSIVSVAINFPSAGQYYWRVTAAEGMDDGAPRGPASAPQTLVVTTPAPTQAPPETTAPAPTETTAVVATPVPTPAPSRWSNRSKALVILGAGAGAVLGAVALGRSAKAKGKDDAKATRADT